MSDENTSKIRNSSLELLRLISMFLIISGHFAMWNFPDLSGLSFADKLTRDYIVISGGNIGVDIFFLISGYFMVKSNITVNKLLSLSSRVWFYSYCILAVFLIFNLGEVTIKATVKSLLPISMNQYWFITTYVVLMLLSPFLNHFIQKSSKEVLLKLIILLLIILSLYPVFLNSQLGFGSETGWAIVLYLVAGYFRLYVDISKINVKRYALLAIISYAVMILIALLMNILSYKFGVTALGDYRSVHFSSKQSIFMFGLCVGLFGLFLGIKPFYNKFINAVSKSVIGVYLIHEHPLMRTFIWTKIFKVGDGESIILNWLIAIPAVFIICLVIDFVLDKTVFKIWTEFVLNIGGKIIGFLGRKFKKCLNLQEVGKKDI